MENILTPLKDKQGNIILDTTLPRNQQTAFQIDEMTGDLTDSGRTINLHIMGRAKVDDKLSPLNSLDLTGKNVRFQGVDADGKVKVIETMTRITNARQGLVTMTLPSVVYQAYGPYEHAEFEIYEVDGDTKISSVPIYFEVHDHMVSATLGENTDYIDSIELLKHKVDVQVQEMQDSINTTKKNSLAQLDGLMNDIKELRLQYDMWNQKISDGAIPTLSGDNIYTGNAVFENVIDGLIKGTAVTVYGSNDPQQDVNSISDIRKMPDSSTRCVYYVDNETKNNPFSSTYFMVLTVKIKDDAAYQVAAYFGRAYGEVQVRLITNINNAIEWNPWFLLDKWSNWMSLLPYLTNEWVSKNADYYLPEYRYQGNNIVLRGIIGTKGTIKHPENHYDRIMIATNLPFKCATAIYHASIWSGRHPYTLRVEENTMFMERVYGSDHQLIDIDNSMLFTLSGQFPIDS
ncbi:BppU family phage baseplate upper protein [Weissella minor]|uniref:BppU family phage baseplate upper protein n=1 Tax=Weissella minor TaxID=1620 RepID=UPI001BB05508|nr:BppU family phage baseplate upper protein [Weissella minor]MBS0949510.1 BppU family phage baseplate upper protein [Weissella minor]